MQADSDNKRNGATDKHTTILFDCMQTTSHSQDWWCPIHNFNYQMFHGKIQWQSTVFKSLFSF